MIRPQRGHIAIWTAIVAIIIVLLIRDRAHQAIEAAYFARIADLQQVTAAQQAEISSTARTIAVMNSRPTQTSTPSTTAVPAPVVAPPAPSLTELVRTILPRLIPFIPEVIVP